MKLIFKRGLVIAGQVLLLAMFGIGLGPLMIRESAVWLIAAYIVILVITSLMLIGWFIPYLRHQKWFWWSNIVWVGGWLIYFAALMAIVIIAINRLASLG